MRKLHATARAYASPQLAITTGLVGRSLRSQGPRSMVLTSSMPSSTWPNTTCLPSSHGVATVVMKNWLPLVLGPDEGETQTLEQRPCQHQSRYVLPTPAGRTRVGHGQKARNGVLVHEVLIVELVAVDGLAAAAVTRSEVATAPGRESALQNAGFAKRSAPPCEPSTLDGVAWPGDAPLEHELRDDAVERAALVAKARLASAQLAEVLGRLGHVVAVEAKGDLARRLAPDLRRRPTSARDGAARRAARTDAP